MVAYFIELVLVQLAICDNMMGSYNVVVATDAALQRSILHVETIDNV